MVVKKPKGSCPGEVITLMPVLPMVYSGTVVSPVFGAGYGCVGPAINPVVTDQFDRSPVLKLIFVGQVCNWEKPGTATMITTKHNKYFILVFIGGNKISCIL